MSAIESTESFSPQAVLRKLFVPGVYALAMAIVLGIFRLFNTQPVLALELLKSWGPSFVLWFFALAVVAPLLNQWIGIFRDGVQAQRQMADAMSRIAEKDDRQIQEIQTLSAFTAQESRGTRMQLGEVANQLKHNSDCLERLVEKLGERELGRNELAKGASA
jgi:hypothetical protein